MTPPPPQSRRDAAEAKRAKIEQQMARSNWTEADKAAFYAATQPIRDKYGSKYAALLKRIQDTK